MQNHRRNDDDDDDDDGADFKQLTTAAFGHVAVDVRRWARAV